MNQDASVSSAVALLCLLPLYAICAGCGDKPQAVAEARLVNVVRVSVGSTSSDVGYSGEVRPRYETNLSFRLAGKIVARNVEVGGLVKKGDVLARLDPEDQELNARGAQSQLAAAKSEYEQSKSELERYSGLYEKAFISIAENRLSELSDSREIAISLWADPARIYQGRVREVSPSADPVTRTYAAKISVLDADAAMKLGMTANVYLRGVQRTVAVMLPATALFQDNGDQGHLAGRFARGDGATSHRAAGEEAAGDALSGQRELLYDIRRDHDIPCAKGFDAAEGSREGVVSGQEKNSRHPLYAVGRHAGSVLQRRIRRRVRQHLCLYRRWLFLRRTEGLCRGSAQGNPARAGRGQGRNSRRPGSEDLHRDFPSQTGHTRDRPAVHLQRAARAERDDAGRFDRYPLGPHLPAHVRQLRFGREHPRDRYPGERAFVQARGYRPCVSRLHCTDRVVGGGGPVHALPRLQAAARSQARCAASVPVPAFPARAAASAHAATDSRTGGRA